MTSRRRNPVQGDGLDTLECLDIAQDFEKEITQHIEVIRCLHAQWPVLQRIGNQMVRALSADRKILWCGNGGSAADSQHLAAELVGRFRRQRTALRSIALTTDASVLTSIANDYGFEHVFRRQVEALCLEGDVLVGISTSGDSRNVCAAMEAAREMGAFTVAFTGEGGGAIAAIAHATLRVASNDTARIQEAHMLCGHMLCELIERTVLECHHEKREGLDS
jgi:D-sedoheptulose 7-phosphate isomerase